MYRYLLWLGSLTWMLGFAGIADDIDHDEARRYFDEARSVSEEDGGILWGRSLYGPMLFVDRASRGIVANQADAEGKLHSDGDLYIGTLPDSEGIANTKLSWAGVEWTMLIWPLPADAGARRQLLAHEMYHRIQDDLNLGMGIADNRHLDSRDGRLWMRLEWRALRAALEHDGDERRQAVEDALLFRAVRRARFARSATNESLLELNEGLAEYTGIRAGRDTDEQRFAVAAASLARRDRHPNFVRSFAYGSGPAYGLLLDAVQPDWRSTLRSNSDLGRMLARALRYRLPRDLEASAARRMDAYDGSEVAAEEDERHDVALAQQAQFKARFTDGPRLILPVTEFPSYTFDPNGVKAYGTDGSVYLTTRVVAEWGILEVTSGGALQVRQGQDIKRYVVPAPDDPDADPLAGDGYTLRLHDGWKAVRIGTTGNYVLRRR